jgi:hypothetical protein
VKKSSNESLNDEQKDYIEMSFKSDLNKSEPGSSTGVTQLASRRKS